MKKMRWRLNGSGIFDIHSYHDVIRGTNVNCFPWKSVWTATWGKILTYDNIIKRGFS